MSDFKAKMHQICPRPRWGSLQRSPDPLAGFKGPTFKGREGIGEGNRPESHLGLRSRLDLAPKRLQSRLSHHLMTRPDLKFS